jgi:hypothetical protein
MTTSSATLFGHYDVQVDSNHQWGESVRNVEISVYELNIDADGNVSTDTLSSLVHVEIHNAEIKCEDTWLSSENEDEIDKFPVRWQTAIRKAIETARAIQTKPATEWTYGVGDTVFLSEYRFPADVEYVTTDGRYVVNMANSGVLDIFTEDEVETYTAERWHRP